MSSRKREPVAEIGADDYLVVCHTHDIEHARALISAKLAEERDTPEGDYQPPGVKGGRQVHMRKLGPLPGSLADAEGWAFQYHECQPGRGAFPAVVFR